MALIVHKYGGTSVGSIDRIKGVASHLKTVVSNGHKLVCVVSAMGQQTNELLNMALQISADPPKRELDMLLTVGERVSMALLSIALSDLGLRSVSLTGSQSGILTDQTHTNARISRVTGDRIRQAILTHDVVIVAGFQGVNPETKDITTLGRGGSDLTAAALAYSLKADACEIYTDVDGLCTADPKIVPNAQFIERITWDAAAELAWNGAKIIHSRAVHLASKFNIPLRKRSSFNLDNKGTLIEGRATMESVAINAITNKDQQCMIEVSGKLNYEIYAQLISWLWQQGCAPIVNHQTTTEDRSIKALMLIPENAYERMSAVVGKYAGVTVNKTLSSIASVSIIGEGFFQSPETVAQIYATCSNVILYSDVRNNCVTLCVRSIDQDQTVRDLHKRFIEGVRS